MRITKTSVSVLLVALISGCGEEKVDGRWYTQSQVDRGKRIYDAWLDRGGL